ncbi:arginine ABC transporter periplasmic substrate-binding protein [Streptomyces bingchenggensis BCW-1]|uniref:Arginine ABC transporter periplasmic substrate-binding protein n=1 Tax=Streptomyces bingchenggensis (strain BCW-1) TaxID=749414 RepID=D7C235_STRBB|nr:MULTISPECIES: transporter substrate-binding domain-containing protein [Streptomyces]ADI12236.1 arginine ABC transporter periplasmic substrate-binding protein [Streptomyces bingchenggensis BCW-1]
MRNRPRAAVGALSLPLALSLTLAGCSVDDSAGTDKPKAKSSAAIRLEPLDRELAAEVPAQYKNKTLIMGVSEYAPYNTFGSDGRVTGLVPDLAAQLSAILGVKIKVEKTTFDAIIPGLKSGRIQLSAPAGDFVERQEQVDFADFAKSSVTLMVNKSASFQPKTGLEVCGRKVGVEKGAGTQNVVAALTERCAAKGKPAVDEQVFPDLSGAALALQSKRIEAVAAPSAANTSASSGSNGRFQTLELKDILDLPASTAIYGIEAKKGSGLAPVITKALREMYESGTYGKLFGLWRLPLSTVSKSQLAVNGSKQSQTK